HIVLELLGKPLPKSMRSAELWQGIHRTDGKRSSKKRFTSPVEIHTKQVGDLFFFGQYSLARHNFHEIFRLHLAVCIQTDPVALIHAHRWDKNGRLTLPGNAVNIWTLEDFY